MDLLNSSTVLLDHHSAQEHLADDQAMSKDAESNPAVESEVGSDIEAHPQPISQSQENPRISTLAKAKRTFTSPFRRSSTPLISPPTIPRSIQTHSPLAKARNTITRPFKRSVPQFHKFMDLPLEIRLQIWESALVPRVHELHPCAKLYNERMTFRSNSSRTPAIFHVCQESRNIALKHYELMAYEPPRNGSSGKGILRFYFAPELDTLFLNSLMGLFIMFMLLEDEEDYVGVGVMKGWQRVAFDAERAQLISLLSGISGHAPQPRFKAVFPSLKEMIIAFDYTSAGKTRFRTSVWPGENGTSLIELNLHRMLHGRDDEEEVPEDTTNAGGQILETIFRPMKEYLENDYKDGVPTMTLAKVKRKAFIRGDVRYAFRKSCSFFGLRPRGVFRRL